MTKTHDISQQFAIMLHAANHPSPAVRNMSRKFATNISQMKKLYTENNVIAAKTLRRMSKK